MVDCSESFWRSFGNSPNNFGKGTFWISPGAGQYLKGTNTQQNKLKKDDSNLCH